MRGLFILLLLSMVIVDDALAWGWGKKAWNWVKKAGKSVGQWYNKHKHWINPLVKTGIRLVTKYDNLAKLRDEDEILYDDFMEKLEQDLSDQFDQEISEHVVRGMDELLDIIASDSTWHVMKEIEKRAKRDGYQSDWDGVGRVIVAHLDDLE